MQTSPLTLKTSEEWVNDSRYAELDILDPDGWPREPSEFKFHWFEERITQQEFERRVFDSTIQWKFSKI